MKMWKTSRSKYLVAITIFIGYASLCMLVFFYFINRNVSNNITKNINTAVSGGVSRINLQLQERINLMEIAADYTSHLGELDEEVLQELGSILTEESFSTVFVADIDGNSIWTDGTEKNIQETQFFSLIMEGKEITMRGVEDGENQTRYLVIGMPVMNEYNQVQGVIGGYCDMSLLVKEVFKEIYSGKGYVFLSTAEDEVDVWSYPEGTELEMNDLETVYDGIEIEGGGNIGQIKHDKKRGIDNSILFTLHGIEYYMAYQKLDFYPDAYLNYVIEDTVPREAFRFITQYELILVIAIAGGFLILVFFLVKFLLQTRKKLVEKAQKDALTGLLNKQSTKDEIISFLAEEGKKGSHAMLIVDVDGFKEVNDTFGHIAGDKILAGISKLMEEVFRTGDVIGRMGGDEYMLLLKDISEIQALRKRLDAFCRSFRDFKMEEYPTLQISCSIGIAIYPEVGTTYMELYEKADAALYKAKAKGRNGYVIYCR